MERVIADAMFLCELTIRSSSQWFAPRTLFNAFNMRSKSNASTYTWIPKYCVLELYVHLGFIELLDLLFENKYSILFVYVCVLLDTRGLSLRPYAFIKYTCVLSINARSLLRWNLLSFFIKKKNTQQNSFTFPGKWI